MKETFLSKASCLGYLEFPRFKEHSLYMYPIDLSDPLLPESSIHFMHNINDMIVRIPFEQRKGKAWVTIDCKKIAQGHTHRRGGPHVDGNYNHDWQGGGGGGNGWKTGDNGRVLSPEFHKSEYGSSKGGMLITSSYPACKAWVGEYNTLAKQGGDCSHIPHELSKMDSFVMEANLIYLTNSTCIHESLPVKEEVERTLIRITLPDSLEIQ